MHCCSRHLLALPGETYISLVMDFRLGHVFRTPFLVEDYITLPCCMSELLCDLPWPVNAVGRDVSDSEPQL